MTETKTHFKFRTKFAKLVNNENSSAITNAFQKFCHEYDEYDASALLWGLTILSDSSLENALNCLGLDCNIISRENIQLLRNELRSQYKHFHPDFFAPKLSDACQTAFTELHQHSDIIVANIVYETCEKILSSKDVSPFEISRIKHLLSADKETMYFGGIRSLGFDYLEAVCLKPYHEAIYNLFIELCDEYMRKPSCNITSNEPTATEELKTSDEITATSTYMEFEPLTPEKILLHKDIFSRFVAKKDYNILPEISAINLDLNEVILKEIKIANFIKAAEALN